MYNIDVGKLHVNLLFFWEVRDMDTFNCKYRTNFDDSLCEYNIFPEKVQQLYSLKEAITLIEIYGNEDCAELRMLLEKVEENVVNSNGRLFRMWLASNGEEYLNRIRTELIKIENRKTRSVLMEKVLELMT